MHPLVLFPIAALVLISRADEQGTPRSPCPCDAQVVVVADTALAHHPGVEAIADTGATYRLGYLTATGMSKAGTRRLMKRMGLTTGEPVKCDQAFLRSLCQRAPRGACLEAVTIKAVGPLNFMPDGSLNITLRYRARD